MMSYSNRLNTSDPKNETVQTIPERDIALCTSNNNSNTITITTPSNRIVQNYLNSNSNTNTNLLYNNQMNQFSTNSQINDNNIQYSAQILTSNLNKLSIHNNPNQNSYQLNNYFNNQQEQYLHTPHLNNFDFNYTNHNHQIKQFMNQAPVMLPTQQYTRTSFHERDDLNFTNSSGSSNAINHNFDHPTNVIVDRLQTKILLLEQQLKFQNSANVHSQVNQANIMDLKIKEVEAAAAGLRADLDKETAKDFKINKLEEILCQREYEIEELMKKRKSENIEYEQEISKLKLTVQKKDEEMIEFKTLLANSQKDFDILKAKNRELESYLSTLPTMDEVREAKRLTDEARVENDRCKIQINEYEKKILKAKILIKEKQNEVKNLEEKLKQKDLEKDKIQKEYDNFRELSKSVDELVDLRKEHSKVNAELECARKLISAHRDQLNTLQAKHQEEIYKLKEQIRLESELTIALREEGETKDKTVNELKSTVKELTNYNQCLINNNLDLNSKISSYETVMNSDYQKLLKVLCKELEICKNKLNTLVNNCICIYEGKEFNAASLIYDVGTNYANFEESDQVITGVLSPDYLRTTINDLKKLKEKIDDLRLSVSNKFAEKLGDDCNACSIQ